MVVVDASVIVALHRKGEVGHTSSYAWYHQMVESGQELIAPSILLSEVTAAIARHPGLAASALSVAELIVRDELIDLQPVSTRLALESARLAVSLGLKGCDAVYVALAKQNGATLVTLDEQQLVRGSQAVETRRPGE